MSWDLVASDVALHGGLSEEEARRVSIAITEELGTAALPADRRELPRILPDWLAGVLARAHGDGSAGERDVYVRVSRRLAVDDARAMELTKLVASAVAHRTDDAAIQALRTHLPDGVAALFVDRPHAGRGPLPDRITREPAPGKGHKLSDARPGARDDLATGRAGSKHSVDTDD